MKGWFLIERADGTEYFVCKKCGHSADVPYDRCPECEGEETIINKAHLRPTVSLPMCKAKDEAICEEMTKDGHCNYSKPCPNKDERPQSDIFPMEIVAGKCPIEAGGNCPLRPQGHWIKEIHSYDGAYHLKCSVCGKWGGLTDKGHNHEFNFCPNCGADMRKGGAENDEKRGNFNNNSN